MPNSVASSCGDIRFARAYFIANLRGCYLWANNREGVVPDAWVAIVLTRARPESTQMICAQSAVAARGSEVVVEKMIPETPIQVRT